LAYLSGGKWQRIIFVGSIAYKKIDMVKGQTKLPQSGDVKLIEPSVQAIHEMTTAIQAVFMLGAEKFADAGELFDGGVGLFRMHGNQILDGGPHRIGQ
jgi:hypothetical protein